MDFFTSTVLMKDPAAHEETVPPAHSRNFYKTNMIIVSKHVYIVLYCSIRQLSIAKADYIIHIAELGAVFLSFFKLKYSIAYSNI